VPCKALLSVLGALTCIGEKTVKDCGDRAPPPESMCPDDTGIQDECIRCCTMISLRLLREHAKICEGEEEGSST
ncbi:hypothetical protein DPMN_001715, partial [Dreissena polymorpha]